MINFRLVIKNPWSKGVFLSLWEWTHLLWGHKVLELQLYKYGVDFFGTALSTGWRGRDHAGPEFELIAFGRTLVIKVYDSRHWDYNNHKWEEYSEENPCLKAE